jgi:hypothetical protein
MATIIASEDARIRGLTVSTEEMDISIFPAVGITGRGPPASNQHRILDLPACKEHRDDLAKWIIPGVLPAEE